MKEKYLIAIDSDGTLRSSDGIISENMKNITKQLLKQNCNIVICTARPRYHTIELVNELKSSNIIITSNGAEIYDIESKKIIYSKYIDYSSCLTIYNLACKYHIRVIFVSSSAEYVNNYVTNEFQKLLTDENITKISNNNIRHILAISTDKASLKKVYQQIQKNCHLEISYSSNTTKDYDWFCVNSLNTNKGIALKYLSEYLNIPQKNVIAIGNDNNDISMVSFAKIGVAVANSTPELLKSADIITKSNNDDGVYLFLKKWSETQEKISQDSK